MKKHIKRAFGFLGLFLVAAITVFAATLPVPEALAISSLTDTITVRVVGGSPHVEFTEPKDGAVFVSPDRTISFIYDNVKNAVIMIEYTDEEGNVHEYLLDDIDADYQVGSGSIDLDLSGLGYGYGDYVVTITGRSDSALLDENSISFSYYPVTGEVADDTKSDNAILDLNYDPESEDIEKFEISIYDEDGNLVTKIPTITATPPTTKLTLPFADNKLPAGNYKIEITTIDTSGKPHGPYIINYNYKPVVVPNTGGLLNSLNISKTDYLITGLIVFFIVGVSGVVFIAKSNKRSNKRR